MPSAKGAISRTVPKGLSASTHLHSLNIRMVCVICVMPMMASITAGAQQSKGKGAPAAPGSLARIAAGKKLFTKNCSHCHGAKGQGGEGPNLQKLSLSDAAIRTAIKEGVKGEMPAFGGKFKDADLAALTAFIRTLK